MCWGHIEPEHAFKLHDEFGPLVLGNLVEVVKTPLDGGQLVDLGQAEKIPILVTTLERNEEAAVGSRHLADDGPLAGAAAPCPRLQVNGFVGSPLAPYSTFESFVVGPANRIAHAGAVQAAETVFARQRSFGPLFITSRGGTP